MKHYKIIKTLNYPKLTEQNRTDILFQDVYKVHSHNTIYINTSVTFGICYTEIIHIYACL